MNNQTQKTPDVQSWFRTIMPTCQQASTLQSLALDRQLSWPARVRLRFHLLLCKWCRRYGKQLRLLQEAAHQYPSVLLEPEPDSLSLEARERLKRALGKKAP